MDAFLAGWIAGIVAFAVSQCVARWWAFPVVGVGMYLSMRCLVG